MLHQPIYLTDETSLRFGQDVQLTGYLAYDHHRSLLYLITEEGYEVLSVNLLAYGLPTPPGGVWIKDWSEHAGLTAQLISLQVATYDKTALVGPFESPAHLVHLNVQNK